MATLCNIEEASDSIITLLKTNKKSFIHDGNSQSHDLKAKQGYTASVLSKI